MFYLLGAILILAILWTIGQARMAKSQYTCRITSFPGPLAKDENDELRMNENNATIPASAIVVAAWKVEAEVKEVMDDWKGESDVSRAAR